MTLILENWAPIIENQGRFGSDSRESAPDSREPLFNVNLILENRAPILENRAQIKNAFQSPQGCFSKKQALKACLGSGPRLRATAWDHLSNHPPMSCDMGFGVSQCERIGCETPPWHANLRCDNTLCARGASQRCSPDIHSLGDKIQGPSWGQQI